MFNNPRKEESMTTEKVLHNYCKNCGTETSPDQTLCVSCSAKLSTEAETGADPEAGKSFEISCPHCGETLMGNESIAGLNVECPCCSKKFIVPSAPAESSASQMQETPQPQSGSATSASVVSRQKPDDRSVGKRRFRIKRSQTPNYNRLNTSEKGQPEEQADPTMDTNSEDETDKGHPFSGLFNVFASVLYVVAAALFALHAFMGVSLIPELLVINRTDWTFAAIFAAGGLFDRLARKSSRLVMCICMASMAVCFASYYYERSEKSKYGEMGQLENQLKVGELLVESLSGNDVLKKIARVGKYTDVKIDLDSKKHERNSDGKFGDMFKGKICVELFPRKKGSVAGSNQYKSSSISVWYDVKVFFDERESLITLEDAQMREEYWTSLLKATGLTEAEIALIGATLQTDESDESEDQLQQADESDEGAAGNDQSTMIGVDIVKGYEAKENGYTEAQLKKIAKKFNGKRVTFVNGLVSNVNVDDDDDTVSLTVCFGKDKSFGPLGSFGVEAKVARSMAKVAADLDQGTKIRRLSGKVTYDSDFFVIFTIDDATFEVGR